VANHDLVLADLSTGNTVLPDVADAILIFDEAHHLNAKALSHFSLCTNIEFIKSSIRQTQGISEKIAKLIEQEPIEVNVKQVDNYLQDLTELLKMLSFEEDVSLFNQGQVDDGIAETSTQISILITQALSRFAILKDTWTDYLRIQPVDKNIADPLNS
jgi:ATP-dependent DNA helicase DinG